MNKGTRFKAFHQATGEHTYTYIGEFPDEDSCYKHKISRILCNKCGREMVALPIYRSEGLGGACECGGLIDHHISMVEDAWFNNRKITILEG
jgi:hypothetical protein